MPRYSHSKGLMIRGLTFGPSGIRFTREPNSFNRCVAGRLRGGKPGSQKAARDAFTAAAKAC